MNYTEEEMRIYLEIQNHTINHPVKKVIDKILSNMLDPISEENKKILKSYFNISFYKMFEKKDTYLIEDEESNYYRSSNLNLIEQINPLFAKLVEKELTEQDESRYKKMLKKILKEL